MRRFLKIMAAAIMCLLMVVNLVGCGSGADSEPVSEEVIALENTIKKAELPANSVKANLYFDNTQSMYGYINAASNFAVACGDLIETVKGYANYSMNALVRKDNGFLGGAMSTYLISGARTSIHSIKEASTMLPVNTVRSACFSKMPTRRSISMS